MTESSKDKSERLVSYIQQGDKARARQELKDLIKEKVRERLLEQVDS